MFQLTAFIFSPSAYIREFNLMERRKLWPFVLFLLFLIPLCHSFASALERGTNIASFGMGLLTGYWSKVLLFGTYSLLSGGLVYFLANLVNSQGTPGADAGRFSTLYLATWFPLTFMPALALAFRQAGGPGRILTGFGWLLVLVWILLLQISVVRHSFGMNLAKSVLVYAAAGVLVPVLVFLLFASLAASAAGAM